MAECDCSPAAVLSEKDHNMNEEPHELKEETLDPTDWESVRALGHRILDDALDYAEHLRDRPVWQHAPPHIKAHFAGPPPA